MALIEGGLGGSAFLEASEWTEGLEGGASSLWDGYSSDRLDNLGSQCLKKVDSMINCLENNDEKNNGNSVGNQFDAFSLKNHSDDNMYNLHTGEIMGDKNGNLQNFEGTRLGVNWTYGNKFMDGQICDLSALPKIQDKLEEDIGRSDALWSPAARLQKTDIKMEKNESKIRKNVANMLNNSPNNSPRGAAIFEENNTSQIPKFTDLHSSKNPPHPPQNMGPRNGLQSVLHRSPHKNFYQSQNNAKSNNTCHNSDNYSNNYYYQNYPHNHKNFNKVMNTSYQQNGVRDDEYSKCASVEASNRNGSFSKSPQNPNNSYQQNNIIQKLAYQVVGREGPPNAHIIVRGGNGERKTEEKSRKNEENSRKNEENSRKNEENTRKNEENGRQIGRGDPEGVDKTTQMGTNNCGQNRTTNSKQIQNDSAKNIVEKKSPTILHLSTRPDSQPYNFRNSHGGKHQSYKNGTPYKSTRTSASHVYYAKAKLPAKDKLSVEEHPEDNREPSVSDGTSKGENKEQKTDKCATNEQKYPQKSDALKYALKYEQKSEPKKHEYYGQPEYHEREHYEQKNSEQEYYQREYYQQEYYQRKYSEAKLDQANVAFAKTADADNIHIVDDIGAKYDMTFSRFAARNAPNTEKKGENNEKSKKNPPHNIQSGNHLHISQKKDPPYDDSAILKVGPSRSIEEYERNCELLLQGNPEVVGHTPFHAPQNNPPQNNPPQNTHLQNPPPHNNNFESFPLQKNHFENPPPQNNHFENPPPQNNHFENPPPQNIHLENPPPQNSHLENPPPQNSQLENSPPQNTLSQNTAPANRGSQSRGEGDEEKVYEGTMREKWAEGGFEPGTKWSECVGGNGGILLDILNKKSIGEFAGGNFDCANSSGKYTQNPQVFENIHNGKSNLPHSPSTPSTIGSFSLPEKSPHSGKNGSQNSPFFSPPENAPIFSSPQNPAPFPHNPVLVTPSQNSHISRPPFSPPNILRNPNSSVALQNSCCGASNSAILFRQQISPPLNPPPHNRTQNYSPQNPQIVPTGCLPPDIPSDITPPCRTQAIAWHMRQILKLLPVDVDGEDLRDTPRRFAEALSFLTSGYYRTLTDVVAEAVFAHESCGLVIVKGISVFSLCEHHVLPFFGKCHIGYRPREHVLGLSKLGRITSMYSQRLQIQERLTDQIAEAVDSAVDPEGLVVFIEATHMCMSMRGVQETHACTSTIASRGSMRSPEEVQLFLTAIGQEQV